MAKVDVYDIKGTRVQDVDVADELFDSKVQEPLVHNVVVGYLSNQRRAQARTKNRALVSGGGRKPWRQKGTGRARAGSNTSPIWKRGGTAHGPNSRKYEVRLPRKARRKALAGLLAARKQDGRVKVVEDFSFEQPRTKNAAEVLANLQLHGRVLLVMKNPDVNTRKSFRNLEKVVCRDASTLNAYDVIACDWLLITRESIKALQERLCGSGNDR